MIKLKKLKSNSIPAAIERARNYRILNEPEAAESICLDILETAPDHQEAMITLIMSLTDQFAGSGLNPAFNTAMHMVEKLENLYCKSSYKGIIYERRAKNHFKMDTFGSGSVAYQWFRSAMAEFETALTSCDPDNQDAALRWNACARFINGHPSLMPDATPDVVFWLDAYETPHSINSKGN